jgi:hypothetical protein
MTMQVVLMCTQPQTLEDRGYNKMAERAVLAALEKAMEISASNIAINKPDGILTAHVVEVATALLSSATLPCSVAVQGAALSSEAPHNTSGVLEGAATAAAASRVPAVEQGSAEPQGLAAGEVAIDGAVTFAHIQPVRYTLKDPHLRLACCECESAVQNRTCKHKLAVLMHLFPGLESRRTLLMFLGTRLGMKGGCQPDCSSPDSLRPLLNKLHQLRAADDMPSLALPDAARERGGAPSSAGVASVQLAANRHQQCKLPSRSVWRCRCHMHCANASTSSRCSVQRGAQPFSGQFATGTLVPRSCSAAAQGQGGHGAYWSHCQG